MWQRHESGWRMAAVAWTLVLASPTWAAVPAAEVLECQADRTLLKSVLEGLRSSSLRGLPSDADGATRASDVDLLLLRLHRLTERVPSLRGDVEALVLSWHYCVLTAGGQLWDLTGDGQVVPAREPFPAGGEGFTRWGFRADSAPVDLDLIQRGPLGPGQLEAFLHVLLVERCFSGVAAPGSLYEPVGRLPPVPPPSAPWLPHCPAPELPHPPSTASPSVTPPSTPGVVPVSVPPKPNAHLSVAPLTGMTAGSPFNTGAPPAPAAVGLRLSGAYYTTFHLATGMDVGATASYSPFDGAFVRAGVVHALGDERLPLVRYGWGLGYDDWHPGTVSLQLNNWGPIAPSNGLAWREAQLDLGYKAPLPDWLGEYLGLSAHASTTWGHLPAFSLSATVKPVDRLSASVSLIMAPWAPQHLSWSYSFGFSDWHPFTVSVVYANWGPNKLTQLNFVQNGAFSLALSWAL